MADSGPQGIAVRIVDIHGADLATGILGSVDISAASLAALEQTTVTLDAASLAALESITAVGPLTNTELRAAGVPIVGAAATGAAVAGNPVLIGGKDGSGNAQPFLTDTSGRPTFNVLGLGTTGLANQGSNRALLVSEEVTTNNLADAVSTSYYVPLLGGVAVINRNVMNYLFNGTTHDRQRNNQDITLVASAASVATVTTADQVNYNAKGIKVVLDMTAVGTGSVTLEIDGKDAVSGKYYAILTGAAVITNSTNVYTIYPGATVLANASVSDFLPRTWRVKVTANNANAATYSVGASLIL